MVKTLPWIWESQVGVGGFVIGFQRKRRLRESLEKGVSVSRESQCS